jgi:hypothetical protein
MFRAYFIAVFANYAVFAAFATTYKSMVAEKK